MVNETDRDISVPRNTQMYGVTGSGQLVALITSLSGELSVDVTIGDVVAIVSGQIYVHSGEIHVVSGSVTLGSGGRGIGLVGVNSGRVSVQSGEVHILSGTVNAQILSGEVHVTSGELVSKISGENVVITSAVISITSGQKIITTDDAGNVAEVITTQSDGFSDTKKGLITTGFTYIYDKSAGNWRRLYNNKSGQSVLTVASSGQDYVLVKNSGELISLSSGTNILGQVSVLSGQLYIKSGEIHVMSGVVTVSGNVLKTQAPSAILAGYSQITDASGGVQLSSGVVVAVSIRSRATSGKVWIGSPGVQSGTGYPLINESGIRYGCDSPSLNVDNLNKVYCISEFSGDYVSWIAEVE